MKTPLPRGIERDETEHGRLYFTRAQLVEYGNRCIADALKTIKEPKQRTETAKQSASVESLMSLFGMKQ